MTNTVRYVLDTNVLSSFHSAGWFEGLEIWSPDYELIVSEAVWSEFMEYADRFVPDWLRIEVVDLGEIRTERPGDLAPADWTCIGLGTRLDDSVIVTNDTGIRNVVERRNLRCEWGTLFLLRTFRRCGISKSQLDDGAAQYISDLWLPDEVAQEIRSAEKS
jgi:hypothetical protein